MKILCHRGLWTKPAEQNSARSIERAFGEGFGVEVDVRDQHGHIVISHDPPRASAALLGFEDVIDIHRRCNPTAPVAVNIKADGLSPMFSAEFGDDLLDRPYFFFDMSAPELLRYAAAGLRWFTRMSEIEREPVLLAESAGVWMDCFHDDWMSPSDLAVHLGAGRQVAIVSPELHGRTAQAMWDMLLRSSFFESDSLMVCTDYPRHLQGLLSAL